MRTVRIESEGGISSGTEVFDAVTGKKIHGITGITVNIAVDDVVRAYLSIFFADLRAEAHPQFLVADPADGELKPVVRIEFADGTSFEA